MAFTLVAKRYCNDKRCPNAGRRYHPSHSTCRMQACVDRGIAHWGDHRIAATQPGGARGAEGDG